MSIDRRAPGACVNLDSLALGEDGHCMPGRAYVDDDYFALDVEQVLARQWHFAAHVSQISNAGDCLVYRYCGESVVVVQVPEHGPAAFLNVCRHRGSQIVVEPRCNVSRFTCPYHHWVYGLDGSLRQAPFMPAGFDAGRFPLHRLAVWVLEGLIFVALDADRTPDTAAAKRKLEPLLPFHGLPDCRVAYSRDFSIQANWKLVVENFLECYHCKANHPEFCSVYSHIQASATTDARSRQAWYAEYHEWAAKARGLGHPVGTLESLDAGTDLPCVAFRSPIGNGRATLSRTGEALAPLIGRFTCYDGGELFGYVGPLLHFSIANDHAVLFQFLPLDARNTLAAVHWLVSRKAVSGVDYELAALPWLWEQTFAQDCELVERTQKSLSSRHFVPGPFSELEREPDQFLRWYRRQIRAPLSPKEP
jgi:phenylpropionate dioxygenase-like ring-hydroxylating dioxygenase large terminal subunit